MRRLFLTFVFAIYGVHAQANALMGEIRVFAFDYCPAGWAHADGRLLQISGNDALYALLGTRYGGNGTSDFRLPDLRGRVALSSSVSYPHGNQGGSASHTLSIEELPPHSHSVNVDPLEGDAATPNGRIPAKSGAGDPDYSSAGATATLASGTIGNTGGGQAFSRMPPYLSLRFCIATSGLFPSRP